MIALGFLSRIRGLNIKQIDVGGNKVVDTEAIKEVVNADMAGYYLWFFPKTNIFLYPENKIKKDLIEKFKRLDNIYFNFESGNTFQIHVTEREGKYIWCGNDYPVIGNSEQICSFMDEKGYIFDQAPHFSGNVYFKFYGDYFQNDNTIFPQLITFKKNLEALGLKPMAMYVSKDNNAKVILQPLNNSSVIPVIRFKIDSDFDKIHENLETALTTEPLKSQFKNKYSLLLYIDLSFGNKVYYKFNE